jgi:hypothetical protein
MDGFGSQPNYVRAKFGRRTSRHLANEEGCLMFAGEALAATE